MKKLLVSASKIKKVIFFFLTLGLSIYLLNPNFIFAADLSGRCCAGYLGETAVSCSPKPEGSCRADYMHTGPCEVLDPNTPNPGRICNTPLKGREVGCTQEPRCIQSVMNLSGAPDSSIITYVGSTEVTPGEMLNNVMVKATKSGSYNFTLLCLNCDKISGYTGPLQASGNPANIVFSFNPTEYLGSISDVSLPKEVKFSFLAYTSGTPAKYGLKDFSITISKLACSGFEKTDCDSNVLCIWNESSCVSARDGSLCTKFPKSICEREKLKDTCAWSTVTGKEGGECKPIDSVAVEQSISQQYPVPEDASGLLPDCAYSGQCRNINDLLQLMINAGKIFMGGAAGFAFVMFVYGGFTWVLSFGNSEKVEKGKSMLTSATMGLVVTFSAYILVDFLLKMLQVKSDFRF